MLARVSTIVTAPNLNSHLINCLDSIAAQTISDLEVICSFVNTISDSEIDNLKALFDDRLERLIIHNEHPCGVGQARNEALELATGEYVLFCVDSDTFTPTAFSDILSKAESTGADLVLFGSRETHIKTGTSRKAKGLLRVDILPSKGPIDPRSLDSCVFLCTTSSPRCKLFKKSLLDSIPFRFEPAIRDEDPCFVFTALQKTTRMSWIKKTLCTRTIGIPCTPDRTLVEAQGLLRSFSRWCDILENNGSFPTLEASYQTVALHEIKREAEAFTNDRTRCQFLDELNATRFLESCKISARHVIDNPPLFDIASYVEAAIAQRIHEERYDAVPDFQILSDADSDTTPIVSVVVPVYNAMPYLAATLDSLQQQTLRNIEIVCVNDGSSDSSLEELLSRAQNDPRLHVVDQQNMGQSRARNVGMSIARGSYLYFMDSDDLLSTDALEKLVARTQELGLDLLCFDADTMYETDELAEQFPSFAHAYERARWYKDVYSGPELLAQLEQDKTYFQSPCLYLVKRSYVQKQRISFVEGILHEDNAFTFACFLGARRVSHLNESLFHRRVREGSTMTSAITFPRPYGYFLCYEHMLKSFYALESRIDQTCQPPLLRIIFQVLSNAQTSYIGMKPSERGRVLGLCANYKPFSIAVKNPAMKSIRLKETKEALKAEIANAAERESEVQPARSSWIEKLRHPKRVIKHLRKRLASKGA
jgi:Glycosyltransferases involved in cell wall biogenesis